MRKHFVRAAGFRKEWLVQFSQLQLSASSALGSPALDGIQARRGDSQPANDLLTLGQPWRNRQGLCRPGCLSRDCWYEYSDDDAGGAIFRLQFAPAALSVCSHASDGYIYSLAVGALFLFGSFGTTTALDEAVGGPSGHKAVPGSSFSCRSPCFIMRASRAPRNSTLDK